MHLGHIISAGLGGVAPLSVDVLIQAGGGGGCTGTASCPGGGGGGQQLETSAILPNGVGVTVTIGAGGAVDANGGNSVFGSNTVIGGTRGLLVNNHGSISGGTSNYTGGPSYLLGPYDDAFGTCGGSGGGAGGSGGGASGYQQTIYSPGARGVGRTATLDGITRGRGGYGGWWESSSSPEANFPHEAGAANTGNGGDAGTRPSTTAKTGGSGVVVIRYAGTTQKASGGTVTTSGGYTYHTFTTSGTFTPY